MTMFGEDWGLRRPEGGDDDDVMGRAWLVDIRLRERERVAQPENKPRFPLHSTVHQAWIKNWDGDGERA